MHNFEKENRWFGTYKHNEYVGLSTIWLDMCRAYSSQLGFYFYNNGLKPVATKCNEPTALCYFGQYQVFSIRRGGGFLT